MSAAIIPFPGTDPARIRPRPTCLAELPEGTQALVIHPHGHGFNVVIRPFLSSSDEFKIKGFAQAETARDYAHEIASRNPHRFPLVIDQTRTTSLNEIMSAGPNGRGPGNAA